MGAPKAILFDLDDTLISFEGVAEEAWHKCCRDFIKKFELPFTTDALLDEINAVRHWYWSDPERHIAGRHNLKQARREIIGLALQKFSIIETELIHELADTYSVYRDTLICLFPNTIDTLTTLKAAGYRLALITNGASESQRTKLERFGLGSFFEFILVEQEVGFGKPDPRVFECALSLLGLTGEEVWMVGDNLVWDVQAPKSLGIYSIWHDYKKTGLPENAPVIPDREIQDISELLEALKQH